MASFLSLNFFFLMHLSWKTSKLSRNSKALSIINNTTHTYTSSKELQLRPHFPFNNNLMGVKL